MNQTTQRARCPRRWWLVFPVLGVLSLASGVSAQSVEPVMVSPMRIAGGPPGQLLVTDNREDTIFAISEDDLSVLWSFQLASRPMGIAFWANTLFVGNATNQSIDVYKLKGAPGGPGKTLEFQYALGPTVPGQLGNIRIPSDLAVDPSLELVFVVDSGARQVKILDFKGNPVHSFPGTTDPPLLSPVAIAVDPVNKEILVSDYGDPNGAFSAKAPPRLLIYSYAGILLRQINGYPMADPSREFARPQGLATDGKGKIFMAESVHGEVYVIDRNSGQVTKKISSFGNAPGQLQLPLDLLIREKSGDLFVTNNMCKRIEVFRGEGRLP